MDVSTQVLTQAGLTKIPLDASYSPGHKTRLYFFSDQTPEGVARVQLIFELETKEKKYNGMIDKLFQEIKINSYLKKVDNVYNLISEKEAFELQKIANTKKGYNVAYMNVPSNKEHYTQDILDKHYQAVQHHQYRLKIAQENQDIREEGIIYSELGNAYLSVKNPHEAINCHNQHLKIAKTFKDQIGEGAAYCNLGNAYKSLGELYQAIDQYKKYLNLAEHLRDSTGEGKAYSNLGDAYYELREFNQAEECYKKYLEIAQSLQDYMGEARASSDLGTVYSSLEKYPQAIFFHKKHLSLANELKDLRGEGMAYGKLGSICFKLDDIQQAIEYHEKSLTIALKLEDRVGEGSAYRDLGNSYHSLGKYLKSIELQNKYLKIALEVQTQQGIGDAYHNLGNTYYTLGEMHKAIEHYEKHLIIALHLKDQEGEGKVYGSLGIVYDDLGEFTKALEYHEKHLAIALALNSEVTQGQVYCALGNVYDSLGKYQKAIDYHRKALQITLKFKQRLGEGNSYCNLGNAYYSLGKFYHAIKCYEEHLSIALELNNEVEKARAYGNLGSIHRHLGEDSKAEEYFHKNINVVAHLQQNLKESQWQVTFFEQWSLSYIALERMLLCQSRNEEALEISDRRRSRALSSLLSQKLFLKQNLDSVLSFQKMQELAKKLHTVFIVYSLAFFNAEDLSIRAWVLSSKDKPLQSVILPIAEDTFSQVDQIFKTFPYQAEIKRPKRGEKQPSQLFDEKLSSWYDIFIAPLETYLPSKDSLETLTFIPDGFLAHLPFGAFYHGAEDKYLIEKYPVTVAPSIQVLSLLDQFPNAFSEQALLMGNPATPIAADNKLTYSEMEIRTTLAPLMNHFDKHVLTQKEATIENIFKYAPHSKWIHIAAHGMAQQKPPDDPHSVFEGFFKLAPDEKHPLGELHAKEVNSLELKADLVFMSACHLGRGNLQKEGSIGPIWSFVGAGARSTIASYWPLPEGEMTVKMVDTFYRHYLGIKTPKLGKAQALQQAVLMAMQTERNKPRQWGAFFLSGLMR
ncbi:hypothetical protein RSOCI_03870 [Rhabdochlamydiaceae symbiont of Dictyostelium giganteum]